MDVGVQLSELFTIQASEDSTSAAGDYLFVMIWLEI